MFEYPYNLFNKTIKGGVSRFSFSSFNGDPMFLGASIQIYNHVGIPLLNSKKTYLPTSGFAVQTDENQWDYVGGFWFDSVGLTNGEYSQRKAINSQFCYNNDCFDSITLLPFNIYKTRLSRNSNNQGYVKEKMIKLFEPNIPYRLNFTDVKRIKNFKYCISAIRPTFINMGQKDNRSLGIYLFTYDKDGLKNKDSIVLESFDFLEDSMKLKVPISGHTFNASMVLNRSLDKAFVTVQVLFPQNDVGKGYFKFLILEYDINKSTLSFIGTPKIIFSQIILSPQNGINNGIFNKYYLYGGYNNFSPNDSIFNFSRTDSKIVNNTTVEMTHNVISWKYRTENISDASIAYSMKEINIADQKISPFIAITNPFGGLTFSYNNRLSNKNYFIHFPDANHPDSGSIFQQNFSVNDPIVGELSVPMSYNYDYIRIKKSNIDLKDCGAYFSIKNISDTSYGLNQFKWYISRDKNWTIWDTIISKDLPTQYYREPGKYLFKLQASSTINSYEEIYVDTVILPIPSLTFFDFSSDSMVCKNMPLSFTNPSYSKDSVYNKFHWDFGDGNTSTLKSPVHRYKKAGRYTVSLSYNNGFCDSTITKLNYIHVIEAPIAGFRTDRISGCSPLTINVSDTALQNVRQKDYYFSDSGIWKNIRLDRLQFNHTFILPGKHYIKQRLTGFTSCIIQTDSIFIDVSQGFTSNDTTSIRNSTVIDNKASMFWNSKSAAVNYKIYKDGNYYQESTDTFFIDNIDYHRQSVYYIKGGDICGNLSSDGLIGAPIHLKGSIIGTNEASRIQYTDYRDWGADNIKYRIQKLENDTWKTIQTSYLPIEFIDQQFRVMGEIESCYRIEAIDSLDSIHVTHSNIVCLPYIPTIFVPNAFSPDNNGINDTFNPVCFGIRFYKTTVFNQWGEKIFQGKENEIWDGSGAPQGVYFIMIEYETNDNKNNVHRSTVTLLR